MISSIDFSTLNIIYKCHLLSYTFKIWSLFVFSDHFIIFILLLHHISKLSKYFRSNFLSVQVSEPYKEMPQT